MVFRVSITNIARTISRAVIDEDNLEVSEILTKNGVYALVKVVFYIVDGDNDGSLRHATSFVHTHYDY